MDFKRCHNCGCLCQASTEKCPECGNQTFYLVKNNTSNGNANSTSENIEPGGSVAVGFFLGFFLGMLGFLISLISGQKENGKTMMGVLYGFIANAVLIFFIIAIL